MCHIKSALINRPIIQRGQHWNQTSQIISVQGPSLVGSSILVLVLMILISYSNRVLAMCGWYGWEHRERLWEERGANLRSACCQWRRLTSSSISHPTFLVPISSSQYPGVWEEESVSAASTILWSANQRSENMSYADIVFDCLPGITYLSLIVWPTLASFPESCDESHLGFFLQDLRVSVWELISSALAWPRSMLGSGCSSQLIGVSEGPSLNLDDWALASSILLLLRVSTMNSPTPETLGVLANISVMSKFVTFDQVYVEVYKTL